VIEDRVTLQLRLDDLVEAIDDAERRGQHLRVTALICEWELLAHEQMRLALEDRTREERP
jgi:hypothetical protein